MTADEIIYFYEKGLAGIERIFIYRSPSDDSYHRGIKANLDKQRAYDLLGNKMLEAFLETDYGPKETYQYLEIRNRGKK